MDPTLHIGAKPSEIEIAHISQICLTTNHLYVLLLTKIQKNPEDPEIIEPG